MVGGQDRNLYLVRVEVVPAQGVAAPKLANRETYRQQLMFRGEKMEKEVLKKADADIEQNRKRDAAVRVVDQRGRAVPGAEVELQLLRHDFLFSSDGASPHFAVLSFAPHSSLRSSTFPNIGTKTLVAH